MKKKTEETPLQKLGLIVCKCGVVYHLETVKEYEYDWNKIKQKVNCKICDCNIWEEKS